MSKNIKSKWGKEELTSCKLVAAHRKLSEQFWKVEVERYKQDVRLAHTQDYEPYQAAISIKKRGGTTGSEKGEGLAFGTLRR